MENINESVSKFLDLNKEIYQGLKKEDISERTQYLKEVESSSVIPTKKIIEERQIIKNEIMKYEENKERYNQYLIFFAKKIISKDGGYKTEYEEKKQIDEIILKFTVAEILVKAINKEKENHLSEINKLHEEIRTLDSEVQQLENSIDWIIDSEYTNYLIKNKEKKTVKKNNNFKR